MESLSQQEPRILAACRSCGADPGGLLFEGLVLTGILTADDIVALLRGAMDRRAVVRLFTKRVLHGTTLGGRQWMIRASQFVEDWEHYEGRTALAVRAAAPSRRRVVEVIRRAS